MVLKLEQKIVRWNEHSKLVNARVTNHDKLNELNKHVKEQMTQTAHMNPHAKMTMQTKGIGISMRLRNKDDNVLKNLNDQIKKINLRRWK